MAVALPKEDLIRIKDSNRPVVKHNGYELSGKWIELPHTIHEHQLVEVIRPDDVIPAPVFGDKMCTFEVRNADSFEVKTDLVMNFASARSPGGGYLNGSRAQEETLCRRSTLYASLSSKKASEMYTYNREKNLPLYSDYMLYTPYVDIFRADDYSLLEKPFSTSVFTVAAPNLKGRAAGESHEDVERAMKYRIERMLAWIAANTEAKTLTLGAWGCGAFGNDAADVAEYFREILIDKKYGTLFDHVLFAVLHFPEDVYKFNCFEKAFK